MPIRRTTPSEMTEEQLALSGRLHRIRLVSPAKRPDLIAKLALEQGVSSRTVRRWLEVNEVDPAALLKRRGRSDNGLFRVPDSALLCILNHFWHNPDTSAAKAQAYLLEHHTEEMTYTGADGKRKKVSIGTVRRVQRIFLHGWLQEMEGQDLSSEAGRTDS